MYLHRVITGVAEKFDVAPGSAWDVYNRSDKGMFCCG